MAEKTFLRFYHYCDIMQRRTTTNDAGQRVPTFSLKTNIPVVFQSVSSERRIDQYLANIDEYQMYVPHTYQDDIDYGYHVKNVKDRYGNTLHSDTFEIITIQKKFGFSGQLHHLLVSLRRVIEK